MAGGPVHTAFECRVGMAGGPVQEEKGGPGGPVQNISDVGGGGGTERTGTNTLEFLQLHYAQETTSPSTILCFTRCIFYFVSGE